MSLSERELLVLQWIGEGDSSAEIATRLHISARTVETYYGRIIEKLGLAGKKELRRYAIQQGHEGGDWATTQPESIFDSHHPYLKARQAIAGWT